MRYGGEKLERKETQCGDVHSAQCDGCSMHTQTTCQEALQPAAQDQSYNGMGKGRRIYPQAPLGQRFSPLRLWVTHARASVLVGSAVLSMWEPGAGDEQFTGVKVSEAHTELEQEMGRLRLKVVHKWCLAQYIN